jgi:hypothetical protein
MPADGAGLDLGHETITAPMHGLDVARAAAVIVEDLAQGADADGQDRVADGGVRPPDFQQSLLGDQLPGPTGQRPEHARGLGGQGHDATATPQESLGTFEAIRTKPQRRTTGRLVCRAHSPLSPAPGGH